MKTDAAYWIALSQLKDWGNARINSLIKQFHHDNKIGIEEFFSLGENDWNKIYGLEDKQIRSLTEAKLAIPGYAFLAEDMISQGFEFIPLTSPEYSRTLKNNLKSTYAPPLLYTKGNKQLMMEKTVAIVGSREASEIALKFTDTVARTVSREYKVVVSGFAKGVDRQALDSSIACTGQSIIVLPQGILTFSSGFKQYYGQITRGDILVLSTFFPKSPWKTELAMARNTTIYGLADEIYVAESSEKGGTWNGVIDGLKKGRKIYVRSPASSEINANTKLIKMGAAAVNEQGILLPGQVYAEPVADEKNEGVKEENIFPEGPEDNIRTILATKPLSIPEIVEKLASLWPEVFIKNALKRMPEIESFIIKGRVHYRLKAKQAEQGNLFL